MFTISNELFLYRYSFSPSKYFCSEVGWVRDRLLGLNIVIMGFFVQGGREGCFKINYEKQLCNVFAI